MGLSRRTALGTDARQIGGSARGYQGAPRTIDDLDHGRAAGVQALYFSLSHKRIPTKTISTQAPAGFA
jgi:hypothetical protein